MVYYIQYLSKYILRLDLCQLHSELVNSKNTRRYQKTSAGKLCHAFRRQCCSLKLTYQKSSCAPTSSGEEKTIAKGGNLVKVFFYSFSCPTSKTTFQELKTLPIIRYKSVFNMYRLHLRPQYAYVYVHYTLLFMCTLYLSMRFGAKGVKDFQ